MTPKALSREIKFRAFDKDTKEMFYFGMYGAKEFYIREHTPYSEFEVMQFTGLHDKNGKEIYESDILANELGLKAEVRWDYYVLEEIGNQIKDFDDEAKWYIIGNIYEHPHLLTKENK